MAIDKTPPFENQTIWNPTFKSLDFEWSDFGFSLYIFRKSIVDGQQKIYLSEINLQRSSENLSSTSKE